MNNKGMWLPLIASIGVGAATFYSMKKNEQGMDQMLQQFMPGQTNMGNNNNQSNSEQLGPYGMS